MGSEMCIRDRLGVFGFDGLSGGMEARPAEKEAASRDIASHLEAFLASGGSITQLETGQSNYDAALEYTDYSFAVRDEKQRA